MNLIKRTTTLMTVVSLMLSNFAFAQSQDQTQKTSDAITGEILRIKDQGGRIEDEQGREISTAQIVTGQVGTLVYIPADGRDLKYLYKSNQQNQSVTLAVLKADGSRIAARSFQVEASLSPEQNVLKMRQTMNSLNSEVDQALASSIPVKSSGRLPASSADPSILLGAMFLGLNVWFCARNPKSNAISCGLAAVVGVVLLAGLQKLNL